MSDEAANDAAQAALDEYSVRECGQPFGLEDGSGDTASSGDDGDSGDFDPTGSIRSSFQATPILVDDALVLCTPFNRVFALDGANGTPNLAGDSVPSRNPSSKCPRT